MERLVNQQLQNLLHCINKQKRSSKDHIKIDYARHLATLQFEALRRTNPEVTFIDGVMAAINLYCPEPEKSEPFLKIDEDLLFRKYIEMQKLEKYEPGTFEYMETEKRLKEFGGKLTPNELDYLRSLPKDEFVMKKHKVMVSTRSSGMVGKGKRHQRCKKCGLLK